MTVTGGMGVVFKDTSANSYFTQILRDDYQPGLIETLNHTNFLMDYLKPETPHVEGKLAVFGLHTGRSQGHASIGPGGKLPDPDKQRYDRFRMCMRHHYGRIQFDTISEEAGNTTAAAFVQMLDQEIQGLIADMARQQNRKLHMDGSGRLAEIVTGATGTVFTVRLPQVDESPSTMTGMPATYFLQAGMRVLICTSAGGTPVATTISSVDSNSQVTFSGSVTVNSGDWIVLNTEATNTDTNSSSYRREAMGIAGIVSDANPPYTDATDASALGLPAAGAHFQGVDAGAVANSHARSNVLDGGGTPRPLTEAIIQQGLTRARKVNNAEVDLFLSSMELQDAYGATLLTDRRFMNVMKLSGGWNAVDYKGIPWVTDRDCLSNRLYVLATRWIVKLMLSNYHWLTTDGNMFHRLENYDSFQATFVGRWTLGCKNRNKQTLITDLSE